MGTGSKRIWFRSKIEGPDGEAIVNAKLDNFVDGPDPLRPGSLAWFIEAVWWPVVSVRAAENTKTKYKAVVKNDIKPLQQYLLSELRLPILQAFVSEIDAAGAKAKTVSAKWGVLRSILSMAAKMGHYPHRDHELVQLPRVAKSKRVALTSAQVASLLACCRGRTVEGPYWVASHLGLRLNECLGLVPSDVEIGKKWAIVTLRRSRHAHGVSDRLKSKGKDDVRRLVVPREWGERILSCHKPGTLFD